MKKIKSTSLILLIAIISIVQSYGQTELERQALTALYTATDGANWIDNTNWLSDKPINEWYGVEVNNNKITRLYLDANNLKGYIPSEIADLSNLIAIHLSINELSDNIPLGIWNLTNLEVLYLGENKLTGQIPPEITKLQNLKFCSLGSNLFEGTIPTEIGTLKNLVSLTLQENLFTGNIPEAIGSLTNLETLWLARNMLSGNIPAEIGNLPKLKSLILYENYFTPANIAQIADWDFEELYYDDQTIINPSPDVIKVCNGAKVDINFSKYFQDISFNADWYEVYINGVNTDYINGTIPIYTINNVNESNIGTYSIVWHDSELDETIFSTVPISLELSNLNLITTLSSIDENSLINTYVARIQPTEQYNNPVNYTIADGNIDDAFIINANGEIYVNETTALDYETNPIFYLNIIATDGEHTDDALVTINLNNVNEFEPVIENQNFSVTVNSPKEAIVGNIIATDEDGDELYYSISGGNTDNTFIINQSNGQISVNNTKALTLISEFNLTIEVNDNDFSTQAQAVISINNSSSLKDFPGLARSGAVSFVIDNELFIGLGENESETLFDFWCYNQLTDLWTQITTFPGASRTNAVAFVIDDKAYIGTGRSGTYPYNYYNDFYEFNPTDKSWIKIADFGGTGRYSAVTFVIDNIGYVGTGKDETSTNNDFWKYDPTINTWTNIADLDSDKRLAASAFVINGKGYVTGGYDITTYSVQLSDVMEYDTQTDTWKKRIFADGINLSINYGAAVVVDNEAYICYGNKKNVVKYNPETNDIENLGDLLNLNSDRKNPISFILNRKAYFGLGEQMVSFPNIDYMSDIHSLGLFIDNAPVAENAVFSIEENSISGTSVGYIQASDIDGDILLYSITDGNTNNAFAIDRFTGEISANNSAELDFETTMIYNLTIEISDNDNIVQATATINLMNLNDNLPIIEDADFSINENSAEGTHVGMITATDIDEWGLTFSISEGNTNNVFLIMAPGDIRVNNAAELDYETTKIYNLVVTVFDGDNLASANVTININDIIETGVEAISNSNFECYPNPSNSIFYIQNENETDKLFSFDIIDLTGRLITSKTDISTATKQKVDLSNYEKGVYLVKIKCGNSNTVKKILLE